MISQNLAKVNFTKFPSLGKLEKDVDRIVRNVLTQNNRQYHLISLYSSRKLIFERTLTFFNAIE